MTVSCSESLSSLTKVYPPDILKNSLNSLGLFSFMAVLLLASCRRPESTVGLGIQPGEELLNAFYSDTTSLEAEVVVEDTLRSDELSSVMLGNYADPVFGYTETSFYSQLRLSGSGITFPLSYAVDSVVLSLPYSGRSYGKRIPQSFSVYALTDALYPDSVYYTNSTIATDKSVNWIADPGETYAIRPNSVVVIDNDSLIPQLRLKLKASFADLFFTAPPENFQSNDAFLAFFRGIHVQSATTDGSVFNLDLGRSDAGVTIYYRDFDNAEPDTALYGFVIGDQAARFTHVRRSFAGTALSELGETTPVDAGVLGYVQAGASCKTHITMPHLATYAAAGRVINKAELVVPVEDMDLGRYPSQAQLFLLTRNEAGQDIILPDQLTASHDIGGVFEPDTLQYRFNITRWVQQVLTGDLVNTGLFLVSNNSGVSVNRVVLHGPHFSEAEPARNMRLRLTFSD